MYISNDTYTILCAIPVLQTVLIFMNDKVVQEVVIPSVQVIIPPKVKLTLDQLFEGSAYSIDDILVYPSILSEENPGPQRALMKDPVMKGMTSLGQPFVLIKLDCNLTDANLEKINKYSRNHQEDGDDRHLQDILILYPRLPDAPLCWEQLTGGVRNAQFFTCNFTYGEDGAGPTNSQKDNFANFQTLLKTGTAVDTKRLAWSIP
ncbi:MAG: hypothetical protein H0T62_03590 [Parachlamydiaceae bacterium]|nr:hypothetical protein [Parachlamydiaceae bacterium]